MNYTNWSLVSTAVVFLYPRPSGWARGSIAFMDPPVYNNIEFCNYLIYTLCSKYSIAFLQQWWYIFSSYIPGKYSIQSSPSIITYPKVLNYQMLTSLSQLSVWTAHTLLRLYTKGISRIFLCSFLSLYRKYLLSFLLAFSLILSISLSLSYRLPKCAIAIQL